MGAPRASRLLTLEQGCIGWAEIGIARFLEAPREAAFHWLKPRQRAALLADPFGLEEEGRLTVLAEQLSPGHTKGQLVRIQPDASDARPAILLERPFHQSYPFMVEDDGRRYVVPEQSESGALAFYPLEPNGCLGAPASLLQGLDAIDPTFLHHDGRWWLFCARRSAGANRALHLYSADRLLGPYRPHPQNPIVTEPAHARPAGRIIRLGPRLLRPAQDCSAGACAAITLCEIDTLTTRTYAEHPVQTLQPNDIRDGQAESVHRLDHTAHFVLIDIRRRAFAPFAAPMRIAEKIITRS
jgi:hypothetical protein